jgi:hypothetical protein
MTLAAIRRERRRLVRLATMALLAGSIVACSEQPPPELPQASPLSGAIAGPEVRRGDFWEYEVSGGEGPRRWAIVVDEVLPGERFRARHAEGATPIGAIGEGPEVRRIEFDGPWNVVQSDPAWMLEYLRFPLTDAARWTSIANGPGEMTRTLTQQVKGMQSLQIAGASVACVRIEGTEETTSTGPLPVTVRSHSTLWYCPSLRAVGRVETQVTGAPHVTQALVAFHAAPAPGQASAPR